MCAAANPTLMAFRPLKTCWPTSCWGSSCGWSLPPLVSATSLSSACVHTSDLRINCTPCASSPSAVSHNTFKVKTSLIFFYFTIFCLFFFYHFEFNLCYLAWKKPMSWFWNSEGFFICRTTEIVQREKVALKIWSCISKLQQWQFTGRGSIWASLMVISDWHSAFFFNMNQNHKWNVERNMEIFLLWKYKCQGKRMILELKPKNSGKNMGFHRIEQNRTE